MKIITKSAPQIRMFGVKEFWVDGLIKWLNITPLIDLYYFVMVNIKTLPKYKTLEIGDIKYYINKNEDIFISSIEKESAIRDSKFNLITREHFWVSGLKRNLELSVLIQLYLYALENFSKLSTNISEFSIGRSTIVFQIEENKINLITGWIGTRNKKPIPLTN